MNVQLTRIQQSSLPAQPGVAGQGKDDAGLQDACQQFEAMIFASLLKEMRNSIPDNGLIPHSNGEKIFQEALDGEYATSMSHTHNLGLAATLYSQLRQQAVHRHADAPVAPEHAGTAVEKKLFDSRTR